MRAFILFNGNEYPCEFAEMPVHGSILDIRCINDAALKQKVGAQLEGFVGVKYCGAGWRYDLGELPKIELRALEQQRLRFA